MSKNKDTNKEDVKTVKCPDCDGKGINIAVSEKDLCATCEGSGKVQAV